LCQKHAVAHVSISHPGDSRETRTPHATLYSYVTFEAILVRRRKGIAFPGLRYAMYQTFRRALLIYLTQTHGSYTNPVRRFKFERFRNVALNHFEFTSGSPATYGEIPCLLLDSACNARVKS
jgi:hypothetical protein